MFRSTRQKYIFVALTIVIVGAGATLTRALLLGNGGGPISSSDIELQRGLVGWWKLDGNAKDSTPYGDNGTISGATAAADREGAVNSALSFDGSANSVSIPDNANLRLSPNLTVSFWIKVGSLSNKAGCCASFISKEQTATNRNYTLYVNRSTGNMTGSSSFGGVQSDLNSNTNVNDGKWHYTAYVISGLTQQIYVDGVLKNSLTKASNVDTPTGNLNLSAGGALQGFLDDLRVYNRALSANEVSALYSEYNPGLNLGAGQNGLIGWWKLNGNTKDTTPNANNGTLSGSTLPTPTTDREGAANGAYSFDGTATTGGYINVANKSYFTPDVGLARTYSIWMNAGAQSHNGYMFYENGSCIGWYLVANTNGSLTAEATLGNSGCTGPHYYPATTSGTNYLDSKWHLVTGVIDRPNSLISLYIDGALKATAAVDNNTYSGATTAPVRIGTDWNDGNPFTGSLDDARIYSRALSAAEVSNLYKSYNSQVSLYSGTSSGSSINLSSGLISEWDFNGNALDATPNSINGTVNGATLTTDRKSRANSAYQLGDSGAWISVGSPSIYSNLSSGFTYSLWLMRTTSSVYHWPEIMGSSNTHTYYGIRSQNFGDSIGLEYATSPYAGSTFASTSSQTLPVNQWHMFTVTYDGTTLKSYWDSVLKSTTTVALNPTFGGLNFTGSANGWNGSIDDARVYNRALSQAEVTDLYSIYR